MSLHISDKVAWSEGVLLLPQHFQQLDRYHESLLTARLDAIEALNWGVLHVELDASALAQGNVSLINFEGIMPDGTPVALNAQSGLAAPRQRPLADHFPSSQRSLQLYLAIPRERMGVTNYAHEGDQLRYTLRARKLPDAARDDRHADVQLAVPALRLLFEDESCDGFSALPIAQVVRDENGTPVLSDSYVPPCLRVSSSRVIARRLERLLAAMLGRYRVLTEARRVNGEGRVEFNAGDVTRYLQLNALNGMFPAIYHLARAKDVSPRMAYLQLSQLAGQLATFTPDGDMSEPLDFEFHNLERTFGELFDLCERLLSALDADRYLRASMQFQQNGRFYCELSDVRIERCQRFFIAVESNVPRAVVFDEILQRAKVASHGDMEFVLSRNVSGIRVAGCEKPPIEFPIRPGLTYFELPTTDSDVYFKHARKDRNLVVWLPPTLEAGQCSVYLYGLFN
jgi:type VI secretion system protein ImpJ